jgi:colanic acid/amylovoran biosynthesis glycosyltransferase
MPSSAYLFERFPSFTQTFCYREIAELRRQGFTPAIFSVRQPRDEPPQDWDPAIVEAVEYLPDDESLVREVDRALRKKKLPAVVAKEIESWGRQSDFLRLYQAAWLGPKLEALGVGHLHAHFAGLATRTAYWIDRFFDIGFSFTGHANDIFSPKPFAISLGKLMSAARAIVTVSDFGVAYLAEKCPEATQKIQRIYNGIDLARFAETRSPESPASILSVGRLIEKKGFQDLLAACRLLAADGVEFRLEIIGEGPLEAALREQIENFDLTKSVSLPGPAPQEEVIRRLACCSVFALPCVAEAGGGMDNLPTVIMEAMAAGRAVVSTPVAGVPEMVHDGVTGFLVPEHDPPALANALRKLLADPPLAFSLGEAGRAMAAERFGIEQSAQSLRHLFQQFGA